MDEINGASNTKCLGPCCPFLVRCVFDNTQTSHRINWLRPILVAYVRLHVSTHLSQQCHAMPCALAFGLGIRHSAPVNCGDHRGVQPFFKLSEEV